jgi:hypothetical protein
MSKNDRFYLAEDPMQEDGPQFVVDMHGMAVFQVTLSTEFGTLVPQIERSRDGSVAAYHNPDGVLEWVMVSERWIDDRATLSAEAKDALNWYLEYLAWEDGGGPVLFTPYSPKVPNGFIFKARDRQAYAVLYAGILTTFEGDGKDGEYDALQMLRYQSNEALPMEGHINQIEWPAN